MKNNNTTEYNPSASGSTEGFPASKTLQKSSKYGSGRLNLLDKKEGNGDGSSNSKGKQSVPFYKLFAFADAVDIMLMMAGTAGAMINGMDYPVMTILFGSLIDAFGKNSLQHQNSVVDHVFTAAFRFVYLGIAIGVGSFFQISCWMCAGERQAVRIRRLYLETILRQDIEYFDTETSTGEILGIMSGDTKLIQEAIGEKVGTFIQLTTTFTGGLIVAFVRGWKLTLVLLAAVPLLIAVGAAMVLVITKTSSQGQKAYTEASVVVEQKISSIKTVASFCGEKKAINDYERSLKPAYKATLYQGLANGFGMGSYMFIIYCTYAMALWYGSKLIINEGYSGGKVVNVIFAILSGGISLGQASPALNAFAEGQAAAYKMFETFNRKPEIDANADGMVLQDIHGDVELKDVHFRYPSRPEVQIFCGISLFIPRGTTTAIVGESGSGKSTIVSLIERFYDPQFGEVLVDGVNIKQFKLKWIRGKIGLVSQEPVLFATSIRENIAYGKEGATLSEIESAAELANASKFISKMPQGFETMVGEHGAHLSGGQKQRIAIARAILKNPRILLLDEATSALDAESEKLVQEALDRVMMNRTTVIVAHRLSTVRAADMIAVVQGGSIVEKGTHSELMKNPHGAYFQLVSLQEMNGSKDQVELDDQHDTEITHDDTSNRISVGSRSFKWPSLPKWSRSPRIIGKCSVDGLAKKVDISEENKNHNIFFSFSWFKVKRDIEQGKSNGDKDVPISRLAVLNKPEVPVLAVGSLAAALAGLSYPLFGLFFSNIISSLFESPHELRREVSHWAVMLVGLAVSMLLMSPIQSYAFAIAGGKLVQRVQSMVFKKVIYQDMAWFDSNENSSGAIVSRLSTDPGNVRAVVGDALSLTVQNTATILSGLIIAFTASWKLSLLLIALLPLLGLHSWVQVKILKGFSADAKVKYEQASQVANEALGSIRTVASFCAEEKVLRLYNEKSDAPLKNGTRKGIVSGLGLGFSNFVMFASYALIFWVGSLLVKSGDATFGDVFKVFFAVALAALGVSESMGMSPDIGKVKNSVNSIFSILDTKSKIDASDDSGSILEDLRGNIEFNHVTFSYPSRRDAQIFRDFCAFFPSGKTVALVGESGSGKSTVIALCQRFYDPDSGTILLDGVEVPKLQVKWLRQQIGVVSQEPVLFNDTILANIAYGKDGLVSEEQITAAAEASNAHKFISTLPQGYQTLVGERGMQLSGGQKQRIAIARAIIKEPKILLLDEATSALDAESERLVQDALDHVKINRTTIVVAHRLSTIKDADKIIVLKNGVIAEEGKHDELLSLQGGAYSTLFRLYMGSS